jgi:hypothetical protein
MPSRRLPLSAPRLLGALISAGFLAATPAWAQSVISAHSGIVHYVEGDVSIDGELTHPKFAQFPEVKPGQVLSTAEGRVEMLLTPGVFLRLAENSSVKMIKNTLSDTRVEVVSGAALIEVGELLPDNAITLIAGSAQIALPKKGLYRIDAEPAQLRVYDGRALVADGDRNVTAKKGREVELDSHALAARKFNAKETDAFYRWSGRRDSYIAAANVTSAHVARDSGYSSGFFGGRSAWSWNPYFGMFTFVPAFGVYQSPFGSPFYSPSMIRFVYTPRMSSQFGYANGVPGLSSLSQVPMGSTSLGGASARSAPQLAGPSTSPAGGGMVSPRATSGGMSGGRRGR